MKWEKFVKRWINSNCDEIKRILRIDPNLISRIENEWKTHIYIYYTYYVYYILL